MNIVSYGRRVWRAVFRESTIGVFALYLGACAGFAVLTMGLLKFAASNNYAVFSVFPFVLFTLVAGAIATHSIISARGESDDGEGKEGREKGKGKEAVVAAPSPVAEASCQ